MTKLISLPVLRLGLMERLLRVFQLAFRALFVHSFPSIGIHCQLMKVDVISEPVIKFEQLFYGAFFT